MFKSLILYTALVLVSSLEASPPHPQEITAEKRIYFSPIDMTLDPEMGALFVVGKTGHELRSYALDDLNSYTSYFTDQPPKALCLAGDKLLLACSHSEGSLVILDKATLKLISTIGVGHGACDVEVSKDLSTAYVANQFSDDISVVDLRQMEERGRIKVLRQPKQLSISKDGAYLLAANFLPAGRADVDTVSSAISVIHLQSETCVKQIPLANGSNALRGMSLTADSMYLVVTHNLGRFQLPTTQLEQGWMNTSALSVIDVSSLELVATILLDEPEKGAAGSWGIACTDDYLYVAHSGTHDFSIIDYKAFVRKLLEHPDRQGLAYDLTFLTGIRERTMLAGNGPRAITVLNNKVYVGNYFSDNLNVVSGLSGKDIQIEVIELSDQKPHDETRSGEQYFHDATFCFQSWQSCTGCHPDEARTDGLNWDLLNDGMGNPRNCKSLLLSHETAPSMITAIRPDAETAVRAGFEFIQFMQVDDSISRAVDVYLKSLQAIPSPHLINGNMNPLASQGKDVFENIGCAECHPGPYFTDLKKHTMGTPGAYDHQNSWDTPTLIEIWRTGPYLHDGRCATLEEVFTREKHGIEKELPADDLYQLIAYLLSL
ncbi:MAG: YVTN family beta-propeller repeat-containing protein [Bacteroidota bacterium]|nr:YVTN family beta-propeller repeat-containing protein [Bacteroidota bacterium]